MTSIYVVPQQTDRKSKRSKKRGKKGKAKNKNEYDDDDALLTKSPLSKLADKFLCLNNNINSDDDSGGDDSIKVHFLDGFLDIDSPIVPVLCKSSGSSPFDCCTAMGGCTGSSGTGDRDQGEGVLLNTSHGGSFTDDKAVNTSNDDSMLSNIEINQLGSTPSAWIIMPSAITNAWDIVVSSNMQCWNGGTSPADDLSSEPTYSKYFDGLLPTTKGTKDNRRHDKNKNNSRSKSKSSSRKVMKRESFFQVDTLGMTQPSFVYDDSTTSKVWKNSLSSALDVPFEDDSHEGSNDPSKVEPLVCRQLFDHIGKRKNKERDKNNKDLFGEDDSESTAMTCNYSSSMALPYTGGERDEGSEGGDDDGFCYSEKFHYLPEEEEEDVGDVLTTTSLSA